MNRRPQPLQLVVDPVVRAEELARFEASAVRGPGPQDCAIWCAALGSDAYCRFWVRRGAADSGPLPRRPILTCWPSSRRAGPIRFHL
ncbi:hypothetical protein [Mycobacterium asiaticum]|uniref:Uncharacterized protein n=1 Tax=Mycobacterium asiaticum TaxID=1790 RepID=A0A1A3L0Z4_MYCAS|nr:hypothetical protein [Mycobacterium asiaticum]OBJ89851.1 hypothetical protein A5640_24885 [Mycobacterium asiaticum]